MQQVRCSYEWLWQSLHMLTSKYGNDELTVHGEYDVLLTCMRIQSSCQHHFVIVAFTVDDGMHHIHSTNNSIKLPARVTNTDRVGWLCIYGYECLIQILPNAHIHVGVHPNTVLHTGLCQHTATAS
jgi:hypothetical protein